MRLDCWSCSSRDNALFRFDWEDISIEAKEISQHLNVKLNDISFRTYCPNCCHAVQSELMYASTVWANECSIFLTRPEDDSWDEIPTTLYYHWNPRSSNPYESMGFYSASKVPDGGAWQEQLKGRGWEFESTLWVNWFISGS